MDFAPIQWRLRVRMKWSHVRPLCAWIVQGVLDRANVGIGRLGGPSEWWQKWCIILWCDALRESELRHRGCHRLPCHGLWHFGSRRWDWRWNLILIGNGLDRVTGDLKLIYDALNRRS